MTFHSDFLLAFYSLIKINKVEQSKKQIFQCTCQPFMKLLFGACVRGLVRKSYKFCIVNKHKIFKMKCPCVINHILD